MTRKKRLYSTVAELRELDAYRLGLLESESKIRIKTLKAIGEWLIKERDKPAAYKYQFEDAVLKAIPTFLSGKFPDKEK